MLLKSAGKPMSPLKVCRFCLQLRVPQQLNFVIPIGFF